MIINDTPTHEAIMDGVSGLGEFRIKSSAKAFTILSSSLYANKIRAIIRELACNAYDSHVAANSSEPFVVHLPSMLEPWFSIRDFGVGLDDTQVTNIYTTYFESTKTSSNDFVGALGLGSKSPFSYTQSFTVTAIKNGVQRIYTAFVNDMGIPSIALMDESASDEKTGVEVKFAVPNSADFRKFSEEAESVLRWFNEGTFSVIGQPISVSPVQYEEKDITPGIHRKKYRQFSNADSLAVMGNIPYPIDVPMADTVLGTLSSLLKCGLVIEFPIGSLEFQPSREGLSYTVATINAIKARLMELSSAIKPKLESELAKKEPGWEQVCYLIAAKHDPMTKGVATDLLTDLYPTFQQNVHGNLNPMYVSPEMIASKFNIDITRIRRSQSGKNRGTIAAAESVRTADIFGKDVAKFHKDIYTKVHPIHVNVESIFVINDTNIGATSRAKAHFETRNKFSYSNSVFVLNPSTKDKPMDTDGFFKFIMTPASSQIVKASSLDVQRKQASTGPSGPIPVVKIVRREKRGYGNSCEWVWDTETFIDDNDTDVHYYIPLEGYMSKSIAGIDVKAIMNRLQTLEVAGYGIPEMHNIYGVRKYAIEEIKKKKNWINFDVFMQSYLKKKQASWIEIIASEQMSSTIPEAMIHFSSNARIEDLILDKDSEFMKLLHFVRNTNIKANSRNSSRVRAATTHMKDFMRIYLNTDLGKINKKVDEINEVVVNFNKKYPLVSHFGSVYSLPVDGLAQYINLINGAK